MLADDGVGCRVRDAPTISPHQGFQRRWWDSFGAPDGRLRLLNSICDPMRLNKTVDIKQARLAVWLRFVVHQSPSSVLWIGFRFLSMCLMPTPRSEPCLRRAIERIGL